MPLYATSQTMLQTNVKRAIVYCGFVQAPADGGKYLGFAALDLCPLI